MRTGSAVPTTAAGWERTRPTAMTPKIAARNHHRQHQDARALRDAPQVDGSAQDQAGQAHRQQVMGQRGEPRRRARRPGGEADRDGQHVIHHQARGRQQADRGAQILLAHRIRATAVGMHRDDLAIGDDQHHEQARDGQGDRQRQAQRRRAGRHQDQHDGFGPVRHRAERIKRQRRQPPEAGQMILVILPVPQRHPRHDLLRHRPKTHRCLPRRRPRSRYPVPAAITLPGQFTSSPREQTILKQLLLPGVSGCRGTVSDGSPLGRGCGSPADPAPACLTSRLMPSLRPFEASM